MWTRLLIVSAVSVSLLHFGLSGRSDEQGGTTVIKVYESCRIAPGNLNPLVTPLSREDEAMLAKCTEHSNEPFIIQEMSSADVTARRCLEARLLRSDVPYYEVERSGWCQYVLLQFPFR